jgi:hypothetical protein
VVFEKERGVQALAEFRFPQEAEAALVALQGREIYDRCCRLSIIVSKNDTVNVRENSETQRDFTNPSLPTRSGVSVPGSSNSGSFVAGAGLPGYGAAPYGMGFGASGMSQAGSLPFQHGDRFDAPGHRPAFPGPVSRGSYDNGPRDAYDGRGGGPVGASPVVMVYNLPTPDVWPGFCHEHVFNLFSCFGDVLRVRLLSKPGSGMIEFANPRMVRASFTSLKMRLSPSLFAGESRCWSRAKSTAEREGNQYHTQQALYACVKRSPGVSCRKRGVCRSQGFLWITAPPISQRPSYEASQSTMQHCVFHKCSIYGIW